MRINYVINKENIYQKLSTSSLLKQMYEGHFGEFVGGYWGLKD